MQVFPNKTLECTYPRIQVTEEFISKNNLKLVPKERLVELVIKEKEEDQVFGFGLQVLMAHIDLDTLLKTFPGMDPAGGHEPVQTTEEATQDFLDYMVFAWDKALGQRGLSAGRSIQKLGAWLQVLGRDDLHELINDENLYAPYGAPALIAVCERMGIQVPNDLAEFSKREFMD